VAGLTGCKTVAPGTLSTQQLSPKPPAPTYALAAAVVDSLPGNCLVGEGTSSYDAASEPADVFAGKADWVAANNGHAWVQRDFGTEYDVRTIEVGIAGTQAPWGTCSRIDLALQQPGGSWVTVKSYANSSTAQRLSFAYDVANGGKFFKARACRITLVGTGWLYLGNVAVTGFKKGDQLIVPRKALRNIWHHAIYAGITATGEPQAYEYPGPGMPITTVSLHTMEAESRKNGFTATESRTQRVNTPAPANFTPDEILARAASRRGEDLFDIGFNNCEHFATWCRSGSAYSTQCQQAYGWDEKRDTFPGVVTIQKWTHARTGLFAWSLVDRKIPFLFFTADASTVGYGFSGRAFTLRAKAGPGLTALYRTGNPQTGDCVLSTQGGDRLGYLSPRYDGGTGMTRALRGFSKAGLHTYTVSPAESTELRGAGWKEDGVLGYTY
jgi:hypothetical protein